MKFATSGSVLNGEWKRAAERRLGQWACSAPKWIGTAAVAAALVVLPVAGQARESRDNGPTATVALSSLPVQAQETHRLILSGGPFPYPKDGVVFGNREQQLPRKNRGYYHEYTVKTPGSRDRGARRIVCGGEPKTQPEICYYTDDHYASFSRITP